MFLAHRKIWISTAIIFGLIISVASLLPLQSNVTESITFQSNGNALFRQLTNDSLWRKWWPGSSQSGIGYELGEFNFTLNKTYANTFELSTQSDSFSTVTTLRIASEKDYKVSLTIHSSIALSRNPILRVKELVYSTHLKDHYRTILNALAAHYSRIENLYGFDIKVSTVSNDHITTTAKTFPYYPTTAEIYSMVDKVRLFVQKNSGDVAGHPMLFVKEIDNRQYFVQVGIPTNKTLPSTQEIKSKQMLKGGAILVGRVVGDRRTISSALKQMEFYIQDNNLNTVAIPYEYMITNRLEVPDSSKWETEIYFPILL